MTIRPWIIVPLLAVGCWLAPAAIAGEDSAAKETVRAAARDAMGNLMEEVGRTHLTRSLTVRQVLEATNGFEEMAKALQAAEQIGPPRWVDDQCQVELLISGVRVGAGLKKVVAQHAKTSPITPGELTWALKDWGDRPFTASGTATRPGAVARGTPRENPRERRPQQLVENVRPGMRQDPWDLVTPEARNEAVAAAKLDAARRSIRSIAPVPLAPRTTVGDFLEVREVGTGLERWFVSQPVSRLELRDDLQAEVALAVQPAEAVDAFRDLAGKQKQVPLPKADWSAVRDEFRARMAEPVGRGVVPEEPAGFAPRRPFGLNGGRGEAPRWADRRLEAEAVGGPAQNKLQAAREAEAAAEKRLRIQMEDLALPGGTSLGQAAREDRRVAAALDRALRNTRIGKTTYRDDGTAKVQVYLDLGGLWEDLRSIRR